MIKRWLGLEKSAKDYYLDGVALVNAENFEKGIQKLSKAIELDPIFFDAYLSRGTALIDIGNAEAGMTDFNFVIQNNPEHLIAYRNRGRAHAYLFQYDLALLDLNEAIRLDPSVLDEYHFRSFVYTKMKNYEAALNDANKAIELGDVERGYINKAAVLTAQEDYNAAIEVWNELFKLFPQTATGLCRRGILYEKIGNPKQAIIDLKNGLKQKKGLIPKLKDDAETLLQKLESMQKIGNG